MKIKLLSAYLLTIMLSLSVFPQNDRISNRGSVKEQDNNNAALAKTIRRLSNRSTAGLIEERDASGGVMVDLQGRFQNVMLGKIDEDGDPVSACVTDIAGANSFFGRDLETGKKVPQMKLPKTARAKTAALHGMTESEFNFYMKLIEESQYLRSLSPNLASITIINNDGTGEGFNSMAAPAVLNEGGNTGATLGAQRLILFDFAAQIWGSFLDSNVTINVRSQFDPLTPCSTSGGVLGSAGTINVHRDYTNAEFPGTWYHAALANKRAGSDLNTANPDMQARFNTDVDTGCLGAGTRFYYGLDNTTPPMTINLLVVLLHEMGHGLGFSSFANGSTGVLFSGFPDIYTRYMFDTTANLYWYQMTDAQRIASAINNGNLYWDGPNVRNASGSLSAGRDAATGRIRLYAPSTFQSGSSVSHFDTVVTPNVLMEPAINAGLPITLDLTRQQMRDIGWYRDTTADLTPDTITTVLPAGGSLQIGSTVQINWVNTGGFNRNVTIELSTDGGLTFPTTIASDVANTGSLMGSFSWVVPNTPTTQGRIRVREHNFIAPAGVSSNNFAINVVTSAPVSVSGRVKDAEGNPLARAVVIISDQNGNPRTVRTNSFGYYSFEDVISGQTYTISVNHRKSAFQPRTVTINESITDLDFNAE